MNRYVLTVSNLPDWIDAIADEIAIELHNNPSSIADVLEYMSSMFAGELINTIIYYAYQPSNIAKHIISDYEAINGKFISQ